MIFSTEYIVESEKERNLYAKFFAGYFFNEFAPGYQDRIQMFNHYIEKTTGRNDLKIRNPHISFDTHGYLFHADIRGEVADILISDPGEKVFLFIEAKYLSTWSRSKDIDQNKANIELIFDRKNKYKINESNRNFLLLTSKTKHEYAVAMSNHPSSNINTAADAKEFIFWEDLVKMCAHDQVKSYMHQRLMLCQKGKRPLRKSLYFSDDSL